MSQSKNCTTSFVVHTSIVDPKGETSKFQADCLLLAQMLCKAVVRRVEKYCVNKRFDRDNNELPNPKLTKELKNWSTGYSGDDNDCIPQNHHYISLVEALELDPSLIEEMTEEMQLSLARLAVTSSAMNNAINKLQLTTIDDWHNH